MQMDHGWAEGPGVSPEVSKGVWVPVWGSLKTGDPPLTSQKAKKLQMIRLPAILSGPGLHSDTRVSMWSQVRALRLDPSGSTTRAISLALHLDAGAHNWLGPASYSRSLPAQPSPAQRPPLQEWPEARELCVSRGPALVHPLTPTAYYKVVRMYVLPPRLAVQCSLHLQWQ